VKKRGKKESFHFAGGGTGGHLFPALALAEVLKRRVPTAEIVFWGTSRGLENKIIPNTTYRLEKIPVRGFQRRLTLANLVFPFVLLASVAKVGRQFLFRRPRAVLGTGGYVSGPVVFVAWLLWIPVFIQEQNSFPGVTTRLLAKLARRVYLTFETSKKYFKHPKKLLVTGNPIRPEILQADRTAALQKFGLSPEKYTLFVFGGSQGARKINRLLAEILPNLLQDLPLQVIWSTGASDFAEISRKMEGQPNVRVFDFIAEMSLAYAAADLVVCRAGATTLAEITAVGLPSVLIPYPFAAANHQVLNARSLEEAGAAVCLLENELTGEKLAQEIKRLFREPERLKKMAASAKKLARPEAAEVIVSDVFAQLNKGGRKEGAYSEA